MNPKKLIGMITLGAAAGVAFWGYERSQSVSGKLSSALGGSLPGDVLIAYLVAAAMAVSGLWLLLKR